MPKILRISIFALVLGTSIFHFQNPTKASTSAPSLPPNQDLMVMSWCDDKAGQLFSVNLDGSAKAVGQVNANYSSNPCFNTGTYNSETNKYTFILSPAANIWNTYSVDASSGLHQQTSTVSSLSDTNDPNLVITTESGQTYAMSVSYLYQLDLQTGTVNSAVPSVPSHSQRAGGYSPATQIFYVIGSSDLTVKSVDLITGDETPLPQNQQPNWPNLICPISGLESRGSIVNPNGSIVFDANGIGWMIDHGCWGLNHKNRLLAWNPITREVWSYPEIYDSSDPYIYLPWVNGGGFENYNLFIRTSTIQSSAQPNNNLSVSNSNDSLVPQLAATGSSISTLLICSVASIFLGFGMVFWSKVLKTEK